MRGGSYDEYSVHIGRLSGNQSTDRFPRQRRSKNTRYLNAYRRHYRSIPQINEDGLFGYKTDQAVAFQRLFSLTDDGIIGPATWNKIVEVYNGLPILLTEQCPIRERLIVGSSGEPVLHIQQQLNRIRQSYPSIPQLQEDGYFGNATRDAVIEFQRLFLLPAHGAVEESTWNAIENAAKIFPAIHWSPGMATFCLTVPWGNEWVFCRSI